MSFAGEVKKEILAIDDIAACCKKALMYGILQGTSEISITSEGVKLIIKTNVLNALKVITPLLKEQYSINFEKGLRSDNASQGRRYYFVEIKDEAKQIIEDYGLMPFDEIDLDNPILKNKCCRLAFVRGMFSVKGSINDPRKNCYHFEITCKKESAALAIQTILKQKDIESNIVLKRQNYVVYVKRSEKISECLALIGASSGVFYFEDSRIYRDFANMANRIANCDIANERKCASSCQYQLDMIEKIRELGYFERMPLRLQSVARMREEYPDSSLEELASFSDNIFGKRMSKSGISHCMRDLESFYKTLQK